MKKFFVFLALITGLFIAALPDVPRVVDVDVGYVYVLPRDQIQADVCITPIVLSSADSWQVVCPLICPMYVGVEKPADSYVISTEMLAMQNSQVVSPNYNQYDGLWSNDQAKTRQINRPEGMVTSRLDIGEYENFKFS
jgi:hypothetical protein